MTTENPTIEAPTVEPETQTRLAKLDDWAKSLVIATVQDRDAAVRNLQGWAAIRKSIVDRFSGPKKKAKEAHQAVCDLEKSLLVKGDSAREVVEAKVLAFNHKIEQERLAEERRLQAIADENARRERAKAEEAARVQREKEAKARQEAEEAARKAAATKNAEERERLQKEAAAKQRAADAAAAKATAKDEQAAAVVNSVVSVAPIAPKSEGAATTSTWKARVTNLQALIDAAATPNNPTYQANLTAKSLLAFDESAANKLAKATKGAIPIPGVEWYEVKGLSITAAK